MPFIGNQPALSYTSFAKQDFTTSATTSYTLDNPVTNENELALFINFVRQEPTTAYTASGTTLTLTSATTASDDMYCVYLGKAIQTVNPPNSSVGTSQLDSSLDFSSKTITLASNMKNTPAVLVTKSADQSIPHNTNTQVTFDTPDIDTNNAFSSNTFTVPAGEGGMYSISARASMQGIDAGEFLQLRIYVNGVSSNFFENRQTAYTTDVEFKFSGTFSLNLSAGDTIKYYVFQNSGDAQNLSTPGLYIFKIIGA